MIASRGKSPLVMKDMYLDDPSPMHQFLDFNGSLLHSAMPDMPSRYQLNQMNTSKLQCSAIVDISLILL